MILKKRIRKQCYELTAQDFELSPCWEFALDEEGKAGQDEATVRPATRPRSLTNASGSVFVLAIFCFLNGRVRLGTLTIGSGSDVGDTQPSLFMKDRLLGFYIGAMPITKAAMRADTRLLTEICPDPFPIYYSTSLRDRSGQPLISGTLRGFYKYGGYDKPARRVGAR